MGPHPSDPDLPEPPVPADADLRMFPYMPLVVGKFTQSSLVIKASGDEVRAALLLWLKAWHSLPAGSLPDDDELLASFANFGIGKRAVFKWQKARVTVLSGWYKSKDGLLYHPFVAQQVMDALKIKYSRDRTREAGNRRQKELMERKRAAADENVEGSDQDDEGSDASADMIADAPYDASSEGQVIPLKGRERDLKETRTEGKPKIEVYPEPVFPDDPRHQKSRCVYSSDFETLYSIHPKSNDKPASCEIYNAVLKAEGREMHDVILAGAKRYRDECFRLRTDPAMTKGLKGWLQSRGWEDRGFTIATEPSSRPRRKWPA